MLTKITVFAHNFPVAFQLGTLTEMAGGGGIRDVTRRRFIQEIGAVVDIEDIGDGMDPLDFLIRHIEVELALFVDINPADAVASKIAISCDPELQRHIGETSGAKKEKRQEKETKKTKADTPLRDIFMAC
jgi:hypothetical protein